MSRENVEVVRNLVAAWNRRDTEAFLAAFRSDCEVVFSPEVPEPGPFHGRAELRGWTDGFLAAWEDHRAELVEVTEVGDDVVVSLHLTGRGAGSGIPMDETDGHVFTVRDGEIVRWRNFQTREEALGAAGLTE